VAVYELSTAYVIGFTRAVEKLGFLTDVPWPPGVEKTLASLSTQSWWPPTDLEQWGVRLIEVRGEQAVEQIGEHLSIPSIAPILRVTARLNRGAPAPVLKHFTVLVSDSIRGINTRFETNAPGAGTFTVNYPSRAPPRANGLLWKGTLSRVAQLAPGTVLSAMHEDGGTFRYAFTWPVR
jgi:hypothetical protein